MEVVLRDVKHAGVVEEAEQEHEVLAFGEAGEVALGCLLAALGIRLMVVDVARPWTRCGDG